MQGHDQSKAFLAGPGPMHSTASDFWKMIWKEYSIYLLYQLGTGGCTQKAQGETRSSK